MASGSATMNLPFAQRASFAAGQAKSGTTLLIALLDGHPQLLVLPEETAYFPTALNKYEKFGRQAQVDYLTKEALSRVLFGGPPEWEKTDYGHFPTGQLRARFDRALGGKNAGQSPFHSADFGAVSADEISDHHARSAGDPGRTDRPREDAENPGVVGLLLRLPLAPSRPTCLARGTKGNFRHRNPLRGFGRRSGPADATGLRFPGDIV